MSLKKWAICIVLISILSFLCGGTAKAADYIVCQADGRDEQDDTKLIQEALNEAKVRGRAKVKIPAGTYYISDTLIIYSNTTLSLDPQAKIVRTNDSKVMLKGFQNYRIGGYRQLHDITIEGGIWDGNVQDTTVLSSLMYFCHAQRISLKNFKIKSCCAKHFVILAGVRTALISNVTFSDFCMYTGVDFRNEFFAKEEPGRMGRYNYELSQRTMEALHLDCISADETSESTAYPCDNTPIQNVTVTGCTFENVWSGVGNHYSADKGLKGYNLKITGNTFKNVKYTCVNIYNQKKAEVSNNTADGVGEFIRAVNAAPVVVANEITCNEPDEDDGLVMCGMKFTDCIGAHIADNKIHGGTHGISMNYSTGLITRNEVTDSVKNGITLLSGAHTTISQNRISNPGNTGIYAEKAWMSIEMNTIQNAVRHGISLADSEAEVNNNRIGSTGKNGIAFTRTVGSMRANQLSDIGGHGIYGYDQARVNAEHNLIFTAKESGICLNNSAGTLSDNGMKDAGKNGIHIYNCMGTEEEPIVVEYNHVIGSNGRGIMVELSRNTDVIGNRISGNALQGIDISKSGENLKVEQNLCQYNGEHGILIDDSQGILLNQNQASDNSKVDISVLANSTGEGQGNTVWQTGGYIYDESRFPLQYDLEPLMDDVTMLFLDLPVREEYVDAIQYVYHFKLMSGITQNLFGPEEPFTRAQLITALYHMEGDKQVDREADFTDVDPQDWYSDSISWATEEQIVSGYEDDSFGVDDPVTREQVMKILYEYAKYDGYSVDDAPKVSQYYEDCDEISDWAEDAIDWARFNDFLDTEEGNLNPKGTATRAWGAELLMKYRNLMK